MAIKLIHKGIWKRITKLAKRKRAFVAVAYCAKGAAQLLPLSKGSTLVVDMSLRAVKSGQTDPKEITKLLDKGVDVHSCENLHAKVFVFDDIAVVGSTNVSSRSAKCLQEAIVESNSPMVVKACRDFVRSLRGERIEREHAALMAKFYRPPKFPVGPQSKSKRRTSVAGDQPAHPTLWLIPLSHGEWEDIDHKVESRAKVAAAKKIDKKKEQLQSFLSWGAPLYNRLNRGDLIVQFTDEGRHTFVSPAAHVIETARYQVKNQRRIMVEVGVPRGIRRKRYGEVVKRLGGKAKYLRRLLVPRVIRDGKAVHALIHLWGNSPQSA
ncbi:MAG TPA: phospholipase D-like domain-containing protein [Polyangia bacterium]|nr:phospholipase D-like domain-containing protein [Polyangia bacterium]